MWTASLLRADRCWKKVLGRPCLRFQFAWPVAALALLLTTSLFPPLARSMPIQDARGWPVAAVEHIESSGLRGRFFGPPDYGAFLSWRLKERVRVYTDTRGFFFPPELLEDCHDVPQMAPGWRERLDRVLDRYGTDYFLLETTGRRAALWHYLQNWVGTPIYCDDQAVLLSAQQVRYAVNAATNVSASR
jgi:hypothetical protein